MAVAQGPGVVRARVLLWKRRGLEARARTGVDTWPAPKIAEKLGVSTQNVYYHLHRLEESGELENGFKRYRKRSV